MTPGLGENIQCMKDIELLILQLAGHYNRHKTLGKSVWRLQKANQFLLGFVYMYT